MWSDALTCRGKFKDSENWGVVEQMSPQHTVHIHLARVLGNQLTATSSTWDVAGTLYHNDQPLTIPFTLSNETKLMWEICNHRHLRKVHKHTTCAIAQMVPQFRNLPSPCIMHAQPCHYQQPLSEDKARPQPLFSDLACFGGHVSHQGGLLLLQNLLSCLTSILPLALITYIGRSDNSKSDESRCSDTIW